VNLKQGLVADRPDGEHPFGKIDTEPACLAAGDKENRYFSPTEDGFPDALNFVVLVAGSHNRHRLYPLGGRHDESSIFLRMKLPELFQVECLYLFQQLRALGLRKVIPPTKDMVLLVLPKMLQHPFR
jgi:hypothetical protein